MHPPLPNLTPRNCELSHVFRITPPFVGRNGRSRSNGQLGDRGTPLDGKGAIKPDTLSGPSAGAFSRRGVKFAPRKSFEPFVTRGRWGVNAAYEALKSSRSYGTN